MTSWKVVVCACACVCACVFACVCTCIAKLRSESGTSWSAASCQGGRQEGEERRKRDVGKGQVKN